MSELEIWKPDAGRLARLFVDLMLTLAEDGVGDIEAVDTISSLWAPRPDGEAHLEMTRETLVHGLGAVSVALARVLVAEREASGRPDASVAAVWREVEVALPQPTIYGERTAGSNQVSPAGSSESASLGPQVPGA
jgi:hypothetical protein